MRRSLAGLLLLAICSPVFGDGEVNVDQLNRMYDQAVAQLRAAQDRRNELAKENEKLTAQIRDMEKQILKAKTEAQAGDERTSKMRVEYDAFQDFLKRHPGVDLRWRLFVGSGAAETLLDQLNSDWPFTEVK